MYGDILNLYGASMSQYLQAGDLHEIGFTKRNERNLEGTKLRDPEVVKS